MISPGDRLQRKTTKSFNQNGVHHEEERTAVMLGVECKWERRDTGDTKVWTGMTVYTCTALHWGPRHKQTESCTAVLQSLREPSHCPTAFQHQPTLPLIFIRLTVLLSAVMSVSTSFQNPLNFFSVRIKVYFWNKHGCREAILQGPLLSFMLN
jgi:hypothetical protein